jgi:hypothetical protein
VVHIDFEYREIGFEVTADDAGRKRLSVLKDHRHFFGVFDDVVRCNDVTGGIDDKGADPDPLP